MDILKTYLDLVSGDKYRSLLSAKRNLSTELGLEHDRALEWASVALDLEEYAQHSPNCERDYDLKTCTCGLREVFSDLKRIRTKDRV